ncbi:hypothetical protein SODALDRAFT_281851 [Sodiomyces alkalinus F11]|uniref:Zn(2)-C6 fungal-type domain-containing protein n=1 Tax=Sodiomyces alkalinus (strain CBS 110278 / VKM F-3762 / F11) TaxID=1314773 RepID=A0A3N2PP03_SODAK|nr:hypothetical protein SODALDRAFT_281851 [Sodiomyces alkalinus F11]ROT36242.1 hypothetical protein SODALDRAFT_281851 [Sodiomyces alkalinus F11]
MRSDQQDRPSGKRSRNSQQVAQACPACRQSKAKCDGARPRCSNCVTKDKPCGYIGEVGQSRQAAMMVRLDSLESLFQSLQTRPQAEVDQILQLIRSSEDLTSITKSLTSGTDQDMSSPAFSTCMGPVQESLHTPPAPMSPPNSTSDHVHTPGSTPSNTSMHNSSHLAGLGRRLSIVKSTAALVQMSLPDAFVTTMVVNAFFNSACQLFHVFTQDQVLRFRNEVYSDKDCASREKKIAVACLAATAAAGAQYLHTSLDEGVLSSFYDLSRHHLELVIQDRPLDAIKVCNLLAMYNILEKAPVALVYVEMGLSMSMRYHLYAKNPVDPAISREEWIGYRRAWRALMFLSSWLSFTLGFVNANDALFQRVPLSEMEIEDESEIANVVQSEMTKISLLQADIFRVHLAAKELDVFTIETIMKLLQDWYSNLPPEMYLINVEQQGLAEPIRVAICHAHLLHLGAIMLLYGKMAAQFVRMHGLTDKQNIMWSPLEKAMAVYAGEGMTAARTSVRILRLLYESNRIYKRCWLIICQAYTSCVAIMQSVAQQQLHHFPQNVWREDMKLAETCLSIIEFCGTVDIVASTFHEMLAPLYEEMASRFRGDRYTRLPPVMPTIGGTYTYLLTIPQDADHDRHVTSVTLFAMLCRPFGDDLDRTECERQRQNGVKVEARRSFLENVPPWLTKQFGGWFSENKMPLGWDSDRLVASDFPRDGRERAAEYGSLEADPRFRVLITKRMRSDEKIE